jgi:hypothetical protein
MNYNRLVGVEGSHVRYETHFCIYIIVLGGGESGERQNVTLFEDLRNRALFLLMGTS